MVYNAIKWTLQAMFGVVDSSGDNKISLEEYLTAMGEIPEKNRK